jgi:hypothetical protein
MPWAFLLAVIVFSLWPPVAGAVDSSNFVLNTTQDLYLVCSTADNDPLRSVPSIIAKASFSAW